MNDAILEIRRKMWDSPSRPETMQEAIIGKRMTFDDVLRHESEFDEQCRLRLLYKEGRAVCVTSAMTGQSRYIEVVPA